jgi:hypothetical protein
MSEKEKSLFFKLFVIILILMPILLVDMNCFSVDSFFLIKTGEYIINNGFPKTEFLTIHSFPITVQNWLSSILFFFLYKVFGNYGMLLFVVICTEIIMFLLYKISMIHCTNKINALLIMFLNCIFSVQIFESRPQLLSMIFIILTVYLMEMYVTKNNKKYLYFIPLVSMIQINIHASMCMFVLAVMFCYIFNFNFLTFENIINRNYDKKPIIITLFISILTMLINPYGYLNIIYIFKSMSSNLSLLSGEMQTATITNSAAFYIFGLLAVLPIVFYKYKNKIILSHLLFLIGSILISLLAVKNVLILIIASTLFFSNYFKDIDTYELIKKIFGAWKVTFTIIMILLIGYRLFNINKLNTSKYIRGTNYDNSEILNYCNENILKSAKIYTNQVNGTCLEFYDFKVYMDIRSEIYLKTQNKTEDILNEYLMLQYGRVDIDEFIGKYDFDYFVVDDNDILTDYLKKSDDFNLIFVNSEQSIGIYEKIK